MLMRSSSSTSCAQRQKEGKKKLKSVGNLSVNQAKTPQQRTLWSVLHVVRAKEAFLAVIAED